MNSSDTATLAAELLGFLAAKKLPGLDRLAALKTAAAALEIIHDIEMKQQVLQASINKVLNPT